MNQYQLHNLELAFLRARNNHRQMEVSGILKRLNWEEADKKFCEERWIKDKDRKGIYTAVEHWDGIHVVMNNDMIDEHIFDTEFASMYDANFTIKTHTLPVPKIAQPTKPAVLTDEDPF